MARADLLIDIVKAGAEGDQELFRKVLEALITEERSKQHNILADRLAEHLNINGKPIRPERMFTAVSSAETKYYLEVRPRRGIADLVLPPLIHNVCMELVEEHNRADLLRAHNIEPRNRVLLVGPPGNGKTSLAEALAYELGSPLLVVRYESIIGSYLGETAVRLAKLFSQVRTQRCVLFFDEFDVIGKERGDVHETGEIKRVVSSLLLQIDQLPSHVVVVTATNHSELLDRAVWRRFQLRLEMPAPNKGQRIAWLQMFESRSGLQLGFGHDYLARCLDKLSFAELEQFAQDVQRRYVLMMPGADVRDIISDRLKQWAVRAVPATSSQEDGNA